MRIRIALFAFLFFISLVSCKKNAASDPPVPDQSYNEDFENVTTAYNKGWRFINQSLPRGDDTWQYRQAFQAYSGAAYIFCGYLAGGSTSTINVWAISPTVTMQNGDKIIFYTRSINNNSVQPVYPDRLQVYMSTTDDTYIGPVSDPYATGTFTSILLDINGDYAKTNPLAYPDNWTRFEVKIIGLSKPVKGRYALRYFVEKGGVNGVNSNGVAIDKLSYVSVNH
ncbi:MAG: choice-of-anchor J domain-containing protein [Bacteroidota bacterium]